MLNLAACLSLVVFNSLVQVWPMVGMNVATSTINLWFVTRLLRDRHDESVFEVLQVQPDDAYFQHFLGVHRDDIRRIHPAFAGTEPDGLAFQVEKGDETAAWCWCAGRATSRGYIWTT